MNSLKNLALIKEFSSALNRKPKPNIDPKFFEKFPGPKTNLNANYPSEDSEEDIAEEPEDQDSTLDQDYDLVEDQIEANALTDRQYLAELSSFAEKIGIAIDFAELKQEPKEEVDVDLIRWECENDVYDDVVLYVIGSELKQKGTLQDINDSIKNFGPEVSNYYNNLPVKHLQLLFWKTAKAEIMPAFLNNIQ